MAININTVYQTVLLILNKEQRGYVTPDEFNKTATQVQLDIFNSYFQTENQQLRIPDNNSEYSDRVKNVQEKIAVFQTSGTCDYVGPYFTLPSQTNPLISDTFSTVANVVTYTLATITSSDIASSLIKVFFNGVQQPASQWSISNETITLSTVPSGVFTVTVSAYSSDFYKLGTVVYKDEKEVQYVQPSELLELNLSPITKPSDYFPVYKYKDFKISVFPTTIKSDISCTYLKKPINPVWNFTASQATNYQYIYNSATSIDFELHPTEQNSLVQKILLYSGVIINDPTIIQVASQQVQQQDVNEKS
jgi:hypothetical protein